MADKTAIEWTDATWNPITGCSVVSPGCTNCYAMKLAGTRLAHHPSRAGLTRDDKAGPVWTGEVRFNEQWLDQPLRWRQPRMIFVCAHGDLFHESVPDEWIDQVFAIMALAPHHVFQVLTKRAARMREYLTTPHRPGQFVTIDDQGREFDTPAVKIRLNTAMCDLFHKVPPSALNDAAKWQDEKYPGGNGFMRRWPLPNVWLGVSAEDQTRLDERVPMLLDTPAAVRWISAEPLLGPLNLRGRDPETRDTCIRCGLGPDAPHDHIDGYRTRGIDWIVAGGESGSCARPMHPDWARSIRDQCAAAGVPFLFKQWGEWAPVGIYPIGRATRMDMGRIGKKRAGRMLDGRTHDAFPEPRP